MLVIKVTESMFVDQFEKNNRADQFSTEALHELFEYYEELSEECEEPIELDVLDTCCDWAEYDSIQEAYEDYYDLSDIMDEDDIAELNEDHDGSFSETEDDAYQTEWEAIATEKLAADTTVIVLNNGGCLVRSY